MQIVLDFVTGKIDCDTFKAEWYRNPEIGLWLENLVDLQSELKPEWKNLPYPEFRMAIHKCYNGSILQFIKVSETPTAYGHKYPKWVKIGWHFHTIASVVVVAYPEIVPTTYYDDEQSFYISVLGDYIGGEEVEELIAEVLEQFPSSMPKTKRKKEAKAAVRNLFHVEGSRYPRWAQEPEWPMGEKSPMAFVSQKRDGDLVRFEFKDVDTNEIRVVEQLF